MSTSWVDRWDERSAAESDALVNADAVAQRIATEFGQAHESDRLAPEVAVRRDLGPDDQPLYDFRLNVDLPDDLASSEYPMDEIQEPASELREQVAVSEVRRWRSLVSVGTKAGARR